jgi:lipopolysaccharide biosynthesis protein
MIALYLPQFHPIAENDEWWGKGFTEWTNTAKAKPLFPGHYQPHIPADLGFYDLRVSETRILQAEMAKEYGIEGFCYYHYWFAGKRLLERPFNEVLNSGKPNFPFCLCWANETWTGRWHGCGDKILIKQTYPGRDDYQKHFNEVVKAFKDKRYITIEGKPIFIIYNPQELPNAIEFTSYWRHLADQVGLRGIYFIGMLELPWDPKAHGFDGAIPKIPFHAKALGEMRGTRKIKRIFRRLLGFPKEMHSYRKIFKNLSVKGGELNNIFPCVIPNWDNSPRSGKRGVIFHNADPKYFALHLKEAISQVKNKPYENRLVFIKSWNEWAEGNHLEPDLKYGKRYLEVIREAIGNQIG